VITSLQTLRLSRSLLFGATALVILTLSACGGGGGGVGIASLAAPPPASPPPPPPPSDPAANASSPLVPGVLTPSPAPIEATSSGSNFAAITTPTVFPMLQTVAMPATFAGNADATAAGGTFTANGGANGYSFAINTPVPWFSNTVAPDPVLETDGSDLDYTRFGTWLYYYPTEGPTIQGVWNAGFVTPATAIPTSGSAAYAGKTVGLYDESHPCGCLQWETLRFEGDMALTANFGARTVSGSFTNLVLTGGFVPSSIGTVLPTTLNDVSFSAAIDPTRNWFAGQTGVTNQPAGRQAFQPGASGSITGMFYGPAGNEVGGVWTLSDGIRRMIGAFGGKQH
jgi:hypothetical protein